MIIKESCISLYDNKHECCGCGACMNICPQQAISMQEDEYGFMFPKINNDLCTLCETCKNVCIYHNKIELYAPIEAYGASNKNSMQILNSASGGVFTAFATKVIDNKGIVFGVAMELIDEKIKVKNISVTKKEELVKLQGSKYVQSMIGMTFKEVKENLLASKTVLFSGTPCQIAGLKSYLKKDYDNLITVDLICHGVPSQKLFLDYIKEMEYKIGGKVINFIFRDKAKGWGLCGKVIYMKNNKKKERILPSNLSSYYNYFLNSDLFRDSCYTCKYATEKRPSDITIGDYWGIQMEHPEFLTQNGGLLSDKNGISCVIINTEKGKKYFNKWNEQINIYKTQYDKIARHNKQLKTPCQIGINRDKIMELYKLGGYRSVEKYYRKQIGIKLYYYRIKSIISEQILKWIK